MRANDSIDHSAGWCNCYTGDLLIYRLESRFFGIMNGFKRLMPQGLHE